MKTHPLLRERLEPLARRSRHLRLWFKLAGCWALAALAGLGLMALQDAVGWSSWLALPLVAAVGLVLAAIVLIRARRTPPDFRSLAREIESRHPELDGRLLTVVEQEAPGNGGLGYLQQRVLDEALANDDRVHWGALLPNSRILAAKATHLATLVILAVVLWGLRVPGSHGLIVPRSEVGVTITPGDVTLEKGSSLVVMARFEGRLPAKVDLLLDPTSGTTQRLPLVKSLADPLFGATVPEVNSNLTYHLEYGGLRTRDFKVTVFEYPRLERADVDITYPEYTGQKPKHIDNTRRVSAVEGSRLDYVLQLNKTVSRVSLIPKDNQGPMLSLLAETNRPLAALRGFTLEDSRTYELQLVDTEGRTNKVPAQFVFQALKNRAPEMKVASPSGDTRPSALEEVAFNGTVWDDFGVQAYGLAYGIPGKELKLIQLGTNVPAKEKHPFHFLLRLEDLGVQPDSLVSWFVWAEDVGPDGRVRRTSGDLYFAEVRPFDEIFRQGPSMAGGQSQERQQQEGGAGGQAGRLADLQKQIINATWKLLRQQGASLDVPKTGSSSESDGDVKSSSRGSRSQSRSGFREVSHFAVMGLPAVDDEPDGASQRGLSGSRSGNSSSRPAPADDLGVVSDAQSQAIEQAEAARQRQQDSRTAALWDAAIRQMERAAEKLRNAKSSSEEFKEALAAEQAAYQALLKLQEHEYSVSRSRTRQSGQSGRQQQMQRQLDQLDLTESENRYETERQARAPQSGQRREQLQVMNRLQELARRQQDVNERLKELQTALQEARTEREREEIRRQLKRLEEEEQQLLADADEVRQRMDRPDNQSRMSEQRRQLEQARNDLQRAAEATQQGQASQALAAGTRAQRQFEQMREQMRRENAGQFDEELRRMRAEARELARRQEDVQKQIEDMNDRGRRTLSDTDLNRQASELLARQRERLTNLVQSATELSQEAEEAEPLMSRELYDTLRKFSQDDSSTLKQFQEELMNRGMTTRELYERMKRMSEQSGAKSLDLTSEMLRQGYLPEAALAEERARAGINNLKRGVERAAESVLGDDSESLRLAGEELERLADQLQREIARGEGRGTNATTELAAAGGQPANPTQTQPSPGQAQSTEQRQASADGNRASASDQQDRQQSQVGGDQEQRSEQAQTGGAGRRQTQPEQGRSGNESQPQPGEGRQGNRQAQNARNEDDGEVAANQQSEPSSSVQDNQPNQQSGAQSPRANRLSDDSRPSTANRAGRRGSRQNGPRNGANPFDFDRLFDGRGGQWGGPITGEDFAPWSDGLRNVEELVDTPSLRNEVASARERARQMRQDYKRHQQKPDWAVVRLRVLKPLVEVRNEITEELARREPHDDLVPIDRDPVPGRYSELVRRYYEELGKDQGSRANTGTNPQD